MMEIEKKFLIGDKNFNLAGFEQIKIKQGYISTDPVIRIRQSNDEFYLTVKGTGDIARYENELALTYEQFDKLCKKVESNFISKTRYLVPLEFGLVAEVDVFHDNLEGLVTVEVEFQTIDDANRFKPPKWFGREVTYDAKYKNNNLSKINQRWDFNE